MTKEHEGFTMRVNKNSMRLQGYNPLNSSFKAITNKQWSTETNGSDEVIKVTLKVVFGTHTLAQS
jgi:hypothetical protein